MLVQFEPEKEHEWLKKLVGEWTYEVEATMGPEKPTEKFTGSESGRSIGGFWVQCEGRGRMCDAGDAGDAAGTAITVLTLGYDSQTKRFVGTWIGSMMSHLWVYDGFLDTSERVLTLNSEGPNFAAEGKLGKFKDVMEFKSDDYRVLTSHMLRDDETWQQFMTAHYRRTRPGA